MKKPTLFVLAAGMGSRYGGLKQMDGLGPNGETIMDYSIFDAIRSGFGKAVFVIRHSFEQDFQEKIIRKYKDKISVELVFQELDYLPERFVLNPERVKPWGTNHAVLMGKDVIKEPFAVINADDFYGRESFEILASYLMQLNGKENDYCMIGYRVGNTLSESGAVARGICEKDAGDFLTSVVERTHIERIDGKIMYKDEQNRLTETDENTPVSMNMWGFTPDYFEHSSQIFVDFLNKNQSDNKAEFFIPLAVNELIQAKTSRVKVLDTPAKWFGVTYADDRPLVVEKINDLIQKGIYPVKLF
ncbi:MAG: nucleotidyltransferase [Bacteroidales bacterium]|jgi:UTP-glucose-1-phosphate uridylyltransferase|nr:nucleotidyltransferase [Bacteroidales bacterium]